MHRSRHTWILLAVATLVVGLAAPATAKRGGSPGGPEPQSVEVHMSGDLATTEDCDGPLTMTLDGKTLIMNWADTAVEMNLESPTGPTDPPGFTMTGCHGPLVGVIGASADVFSGNFALAQQRDGTVKLSSLFDYFWEFERIGNRDVQKTLDLYSVNGNLDPGEGGFDWSPGGVSTLSGEVLLKHFHKKYRDGEWTDVGTFPVEITVTISD